MIVLLIALQSGAKVYIPLVKSVPPSTGSSGNARVGIRTGMYAPLAYFEEDVLFIQYPVRTATSVVITNDSTDVVVFSAQYDTELSDIKIDFSTLVMFQFVCPKRDPHFKDDSKLSVFFHTMINTNHIFIKSVIGAC